MDASCYRETRRTVNEKQALCRGRDGTFPERPGRRLGGRVGLFPFLVHGFIVEPQVAADVASAIRSVAGEQLKDHTVRLTLGTGNRDRDFELLLHAMCRKDTGRVRLR